MASGSKTCYLTAAGYFLLGDSLNTSVTVIGTLQNAIVSYNFLQLTYLLLVGIAAQAVGIYAFWWIQQRYRLGTKTMFNAIAVGIILLDGWGMIGIWTQVRTPILLYYALAKRFITEVRISSCELVRGYIVVADD